ncbi:oxidoreductase [Bradyrhizobium sp. U87765 SZCCT0131]|uniref:PDR/VanB family oxidoreductase n=1 Tax=unclassified Bradyrhizobium TaxID=2631580 RepID=UPI001BA9ABDB|nr:MULTISPECIES: PDR/VanB family oxidoreductase [unclassified Bradyrhizobium]MBR1218437.1 oxidoreductase [Bradyrhizobium sp. U87765 SZCCT0131]MBR1260617.1 oxidoreductase [Bradyrhizobium sp. U87765 SZCCT0134]MBR1303935.1 oxidoreductase [Bradyrhizobium sp. U87765 SZCCT0110]MBR1319541.1 oxidoreductase [Bradyrhizobium sp. U87765 SZCCT0109]MBR1347866.1 oxidoreductase [Bradyrhizobium sp. U87765 SZCCT0048]
MRFAETWTSCTVATIRDVAPQIREFVLRPDGGVAAFAVGSHINVNLLIGGQPQTRSYSLVGEAGADGYRIAVRLAPDSRGGSRAMWALQAGARLEVSNPCALIELDWRRPAYCLVAGGIGITPIVGIAAALVRRGADVTLHYCVRSRGDAAFLDELTALLGDRLIVHAGDDGKRLDLDATFAALPAEALAVLCGPMRLLEAARRSWNGLGRPASDLRYETFGSSGLLPTEAFRVRILQSGEEIVVAQGESLLHALNAAGHDVMSDCERGECGVCALDVVSVDGQLDHRDVFFSDHQKQENRKMCACVSRAVGTVTVDTLYRRDAA